MRIPSGCSRLDRSEIIDRVKGLVFGAVLGDSLGIATQGMTREEVRRVYGKGPLRFGLGLDDDNNSNEGVPFLRDAYRSMFDDNDFSGDIEQLLLVVKTLVENEGQFSLKSFSAKLEKFLIDDARQRTASQIASGYNGALVRSIILGVPKFWDGTTVIENAAESCRACVSRPDPRCMIACVILSTLVARILRAQDLEIKHQSLLDTPLPSPSLHPPPEYNHSGESYSLNPKASTNHTIDSLLTDQSILPLVQSAIDLNKHLLIEKSNDRLFRTFETDKTASQEYYKQLLNYCSALPKNIDSLHLDYDDDHRTFKSLGVGIYAFSRQIHLGDETESFKDILMDIVMQGGDAGTNAAISGALLGVRLGYNHLPSEWVIGLKRWEWLEDRLEEFCHLL
ncbi:ADP-ribosylation/Crystallin J1 [Dichotomocladium elegans]|nr:ADP-ribosylation/Crystallin J1 [Dichotomocladium elegans]